LRAFPREFIGFLEGKRAEDHLEVLDMFFPADQREYATDVEVTMAGHWWMLSLEYAAQQKMIVLGSAHTHPYRAGATKWKRFPALATWSPGRCRI
jgi:proteasome lid subunit RPN8/RPN11